MSATSSMYEDDSDSEWGRRKIVAPNKPHKTSLEVEEIASYSFSNNDSGGFFLTDFLKRGGNQGMVEEPSESEAGYNSGSERNKCMDSRCISIYSLSDDDATICPNYMSRDNSMSEIDKYYSDLSNEKQRTFARENFVRQASFHEESVSEDGEIEEKIISEKLRKVIEKDLSDEFLFKKFQTPFHFSKTTEKDTVLTSEYEITETALPKTLNAFEKDKLLKKNTNFDFENIPPKKFDTDTRRKPLRGRLSSLDEDEEMEDLFRRIRIQRDTLNDILTKEGEREKRGNYNGN